MEVSDFGEDKWRSRDGIQRPVAIQPDLEIVGSILQRQVEIFVSLFSIQLIQLRTKDVTQWRGEAMQARRDDNGRGRKTPLQIAQRAVSRGRIGE